MIKSVVPKYSTLSHNHLPPIRKGAWHLQIVHILSRESIDRQVGASKGTIVQSVLCQKLTLEMVGVQPVYGLRDSFTGWRRRRVLSDPSFAKYSANVVQSDGRCLSNGSLHPGAAVGTLLIAGHLQRHVGKCVEVSYNGADQIRQNHPKSHLAIYLIQSHTVKITPCDTTLRHHRKNSMTMIRSEGNHI